MTKKEQAKELINNSLNRNMHYDTIPVLDALLAIELGSQVDWHYPSKGEFPDGNIQVLCITHYNKPLIVLYDYNKKEFFTENNKKWTYLPKYKL